MRIGLTFDLRSVYLAEGYSDEETAEFDRDDTIDAIEAALVQLGHETFRIGHARALVERVAAGDRWDLVFNICEGLLGAARESQVPAILDIYGIPYTFADAGVMALCLNKAWAKLVVRNAGLATPDYAVVRCADDAASVTLDPPLFVKPLGEGTGKGITAGSIVYEAAAFAPRSAQLLERYRQPVLVESFLPGREFTVGLIGTDAEARVLGTMEIVLNAAAEPGVYSYVNKEECEERVEYRLVDGESDSVVADAESLALSAWRALGCRDAGRIDLRANTAGEPCFIEANPLAGLHPQHSDLPMLATALGMDYLTLIREIVESASARVVSRPRPQPVRHAHRGRI